MTQIAFDIVTPEELVSSEEVEMVVVPGADGDFGVLAGHSPMISSLRPGVLRVFEGDKVVKRLLVTEGVAEVTSTRCTIMTKEAFDMASTKVDDVKKRHDAAKKAHDKATSEGEKAMYKTETEVFAEVVDAFIREKDAL